MGQFKLQDLLLQLPLWSSDSWKFVVVAMAMDIGYLVMGQLILFFIENNTVETILGSFNVIIITFHILRDIQWLDAQHGIRAAARKTHYWFTALRNEPLGHLGTSENWRSHGRSQELDIIRWLLLTMEQNLVFLGLNFWSIPGNRRFLVQMIHSQRVKELCQESACVFLLVQHCWLGISDNFIIRMVMLMIYKWCIMLYPHTTAL